MKPTGFNALTKSSRTRAFPVPVPVVGTWRDLLTRTNTRYSYLADVSAVSREIDPVRTRTRRRAPKYSHCFQIPGVSLLAFTITSRISYYTCEPLWAFVLASQCQENIRTSFEFIASSNRTAPKIETPVELVENPHFKLVLKGCYDRRTLRSNYENFPGTSHQRTQVVDSYNILLS